MNSFFLHRRKQYPSRFTVGRHQVRYADRNVASIPFLGDDVRLSYEAIPEYLSFYVRGMGSSLK
jgi:hypothetical protein